MKHMLIWKTKIHYSIYRVSIVKWKRVHYAAMRIFRSDCWPRGVRYENGIEKFKLLNFVRKGLEYEEKRQIEVVSSGGVIEQETRRFDEAMEKHY